MWSRYTLSLLISISFCRLTAQSNNIDNSGFFYRIAPLFEFKKSAVSLTFDDGSLNQFEIGMQILKEKGLPATFYLITNIIDTSILRVINKNKSPDFEFGSHTSTHPDLIEIGIEKDIEELKSSQTYLINNFGFNSGLTLSYPWGRYNSDVKKIASEYYMAARSTDPGYNSFHHFDKYALKVQNFDRKANLEIANAWVYSTIKNHLWLIEMIHGINDIGYSPVDPEILLAHFEYIRNQKNDIWCSTVSNVIKYLYESKSAIIECESCSDSVYTIKANDFLNDSIYDQPLTVSIKIPSFWEDVSISDIEKYRIESNNKGKFAIFNVLPDNSPHTIRPIRYSAKEKVSGGRIVYLSANPFSEFINLTLEVPEHTDIDLVLCDMNGRIYSHMNAMDATGVVSFSISTETVAKGIYLLRISGNHSSPIIKRMIKN